jgi:N6-adenosine-specific RNA methylase IME4
MTYRTIVADPPWEQKGGSGFEGRSWDREQKKLVTASTAVESKDLAYPTMDLAAIAALPVADLAESDAHLYIWVTNRYVRDVYGIAEAWGFRPSALLTWAKAPMGLGLGGAFSQSTEHVLFCRRGKDIAQRRMDRTCWSWKRPYGPGGGPMHSAKPEGFLDIVEQVSPGPYLEMFSRRARFGWDTWGNQALGGTDLMGDAA